ncbi:MAG: four-carbon acid sugar kinase family protein, partial [Pararhodobacter sp.]
SGLRLLIVADDLTGALDCACEAAALGIAAAVFPNPEALAGASALPTVVAVSTASRDGSEAAAVTAMARIVALLPGLAPERVMKKVDSRLKGHPGAETQVLAEALGAERVLIAPAIPDMGRVQRGGWLSGTGIAAPIDLAARFSGHEAQTPDIGTAADFDMALTQTEAVPVGARGLAGALIRALWPQARPCAAPPLPAPALIVIGSRDPVTVAQVDHLRATTPVDWRAAPNGQLADRSALRARIGLLQLTPGGRPADPDRAAGDLAEAVLALLAASPVATLIASGGETAQALMAALGADRIAVTGMPLPGIAQGLIVPSGRAPLHLVTKSGGFGQVDTLVRLAGIIAPDSPLQPRTG